MAVSYCNLQSHLPRLPWHIVWHSGAPEPNFELHDQPKHKRGPNQFAQHSTRVEHMRVGFSLFRALYEGSDVRGSEVPGEWSRDRLSFTQQSHPSSCRSIPLPAARLRLSPPLILTRALLLRVSRLRFLQMILLLVGLLMVLVLVLVLMLVLL